MSKVSCNKLVRDKIPEIIEADGRQPFIRKLDDNEELLGALVEKVTEELEEFKGQNTKEELADLLEVLFGIAYSKGWSFDEIEEIRQKKKEERGGFEMGIFLESIVYDG